MACKKRALGLGEVDVPWAIFVVQYLKLAECERRPVVELMTKVCPPSPPRL